MSGIPSSTVNLPDFTNMECIEYDDSPASGEISSVYSSDVKNSNSASGLGTITVQDYIFIGLAILGILIFLVMFKNMIIQVSHN